LAQRAAAARGSEASAMKPRTAFDICHELYAAAREIVDSQLHTVQLAQVSKFVWRPDRRPRLVEYVADFARAGARALEEGGSPSRERDRLAEHASRSLLVMNRRARRSRDSLRASRMVLFRLYYLGGAEYQAARRLLGLSENTWVNWTDEIRDRVGRELLRAGIFPPGKYFREMCAPQAAKEAHSRKHGFTRTQ
jgi:hypothetical protein